MDEINAAKGGIYSQCVKKVLNLDVIANQPAGWCGNLLQVNENPPIINKKCLKIQEIPSQCAHWLGMT